jgi:hypothetical protein
MTNHGLNQSVYPLPIDDLQNMAKLTQQILPGGEEMAVGTGSDFPHFEMENHRKKGALLAICMYTHVYIYTHACVYLQNMFPQELWTCSPGLRITREIASSHCGRQSFTGTVGFSVAAL